jgi:transcriptional regulator with XRE-family HTH domain
VVDSRLGAAVRRVRQANGWRQADVAALTGISDSTISRIEHGVVDDIRVGTIRTVASALEVRVELVPRWRGGDLDRLVNRAHSLLHESVADAFRRRWPALAGVGPRARSDVLDLRGMRGDRHPCLAPWATCRPRHRAQDGRRRPERTARYARPKAEVGPKGRIGARLGSAVGRGMADLQRQRHQPAASGSPPDDAPGRPA